MPIDINTLLVRYTGVGDASEEVKQLEGEYARTEPSCFRKQSGGKIHFTGGYWYLVDKLGSQAAWVEGGAMATPQTGWQTRGGMFSSAEELNLSVEPKYVEPDPDPEVVPAEDKGPGCVEGLCDKYENWKATLHEPHKQKVEQLEAKMSQHKNTAKDLHGKYYPIVKQKTKEGYGACYDFWTHEDTQAAIKSGLAAAVQCIKLTIGGCISLTVSAIDMAVGDSKKEGGAASAAGGSPAGVVENSQAMEASFVHVEPTNLIAEPTTLPQTK